MRPIRHISAEEENFRLEPMIGKSSMADIIKRDPVKPEPEGTLVVMAFRVLGYAQDMDGSLMARLEHIDKDGLSTGWEQEYIGLSPETALVVSGDEWRRLFAEPGDTPSDE